MEELKDTVVLRYDVEELYAMRKYYEDEEGIEEGVDWFGTHLIRQYPDMGIESVFTDIEKQCVYAVLTRLRG